MPPNQIPGPMGSLPAGTQANQTQQQQFALGPGIGPPASIAANPNAANNLAPTPVDPASNALSDLLRSYFGFLQPGIDTSNLALQQQVKAGAGQEAVTNQTLQQQYQNTLAQLGLSQNEAQQQYGYGVQDIQSQGAATGTGMTAGTPRALGRNEQQLQNALASLGISRTQAGQQLTQGQQAAAAQQAGLVAGLRGQYAQNMTGLLQNLPFFSQMMQGGAYTGGQINPQIANQMLQQYGIGG